MLQLPIGDTCNIVRVEPLLAAFFCGTVCSMYMICTRSSERFIGLLCKRQNPALPRSQGQDDRRLPYGRRRTCRCEYLTGACGLLVFAAQAVITK